MSYITHLFQHIFFLCCLRVFIDPSYMFPFSRSHYAGAHHNPLSTTSMCTFSCVRPNNMSQYMTMCSFAHEPHILRDTHLGGDAQTSSKATSRDWKAFLFIPPNTLLPAFKQTAESVLWRWMSASWHLPFSWASVLSLATPDFFSLSTKLFNWSPVRISWRS